MNKVGGIWSHIIFSRILFDIIFLLIHFEGADEKVGIIFRRNLFDVVDEQSCLRELMRKLAFFAGIFLR